MIKNGFWISLWCVNLIISFLKLFLEGYILRLKFGKVLKSLFLFILLKLLRVFLIRFLFILGINFKNDLRSFLFDGVVLKIYFLRKYWEICIGRYFLCFKYKIRVFVIVFYFFCFIM